MIYILKKEGEKEIEVSFPFEENSIWVVTQNDFEYRESSRYEFISKEQAELFLETHIHSYVVDGFEVSKEQLLTDE